MTLPLRPLLLSVPLCLFVGCSDDVDEATSDTDAQTTADDDDVEGSTSDDGATGRTTGESDEPTASGRIAGTFVFVDGSEVVFDEPAIRRTQEILGQVQHTCEASVSTDGFALGVVWFEDVAVGTFDVSLTDGPFVTAGWPLLDGSGSRGTAPNMGSITVTQAGDTIEGTASVSLMPDPADPDERVEALRDITFSCPE